MSVDTTDAAGAPADPGAPAGTGNGTDGVAAIFRRVLETSDVTADSDFFQLGGDSLIATRVLSAIARHHGVELSFEDFLLAPTPAGLARAIEAAR
ncbi:acyl carrier protein [Kitasatospora sp. DSM 101779]|uniref:acyl carrier protein n=1 Tax=Kitasatospora sp. DSM 101779 TaxID=2853165 RepID=UPI0021D8835A|nr:acyl carrier protein [Kitasatospora sp. DSM 101779]MCU7826988.1 acyl carrier protein [Kitasatospora sp. DSM 101779]